VTTERDCCGTLPGSRHRSTCPKAATNPTQLRERDIERHLVARVKELGGEVRKVQWIGRRGAPDRLVMLPPEFDGDRQLCPGSATWVELKAPGEKPEPHQLREHERMRKMGQCVVVIDSLYGVEVLLS
jgi:hypothetical protein